MITGCKKSSIPRQSSYNSLHKIPFNELRHNRSNSEGCCKNPLTFSSSDGKENSITRTNTNTNTNDNKKKQEKAMTSSLSLSFDHNDKENLIPSKPCCDNKALNLKPSSLQFCMQMNEPEKALFGGGSRIWEPNESDHSSSLKIWDYSDSEAAPASSWSTLPNKSLLYRPLPLDIGRCTCVIVKEATLDGFHGGTLYSLYTNEGRGRQDRKLAVAKHRRRNGKSEFTVAQTTQGLSSSSDDSFLGTISANLMGSKYQIWDQGAGLNSAQKESKSLVAVVAFVPTITTWTGNYRSMRAFIAKHQSMQLKNTNQVQQQIKGLPKDWEGKKVKVQKLCSRIPQYNKYSGQYELDFRDRGRVGLRIQSSVKNFQLTIEESGKQTILQLGRIGKSKYVMDYRYPLTGYQAFCICLASIDSKLCCTV